MSFFDETLRGKYGPGEPRSRSLVDHWGIKKLYPSIPGGREFYMPEIDIGAVGAVNRIRSTEMVVRGNGSVNPNGIWYVMNGSAPRLYVYKSDSMEPFTWDAHYWHNVEMTCYYHRDTEADNVRGFHLAATGFHEYGGTAAEVYYLSHLFADRQFAFGKENKHGGGPSEGYADPIRAPAPPMDVNRWYGLKFVVRTGSVDKIEIQPQPEGKGRVEVLATRLYTDLEGYADDTDGQHGGSWRKVIEFRDDGNWLHPPNGRYPPWTYGHSCFVRSDAVRNFLINRFSIRTIAVRPWYIP